VNPSPSVPSAPAPAHARVAAVMLAASLASTIGGLPFNALPVLLGSLAEAFRLEPATVGFVGSVCFAGYLAGTLGAPFWMDRVNWRVLTVLSAAGTAASFALSAATASLQGQYLAWALIGFFASTMTCLGLRILGGLPDKVRALGVRQGVELSVTAVVLFALPPLVIARWGYTGAAFALAAVVVLLALSAPWVPARPSAAVAGPTEAAGAATGRRPSAPWPAWVALGVFFVYLAGNIGLWAFLERIGAGLRLEPAQTGIVFAVLKLLGGVAAFTIGAMGERWPLARAHGAALLLLAAGLAGLGVAEGFVAFALGAWVWEFAFTCGCVLQAAQIARLDPGGRVIVLVPAAFALGSMTGPALAGQLFQAGQPGALLLLALACSVVPWVAAWVQRSR
jgi:hypothetical protein